MQGNANIRLSWQASVAIVALATMGLAGGVLLLEWSDAGGAGSRQLCGILLGGGLVLCALAVLARWYSIGDRGRRASFLMQIGIGSAVILAAFIVTMISYSYGAFSAGGGAKWFVVPTGLYMGGIIAIAKALSPE